MIFSNFFGNLPISTESKEICAVNTISTLPFINIPGLVRPVCVEQGHPLYKLTGPSLLFTPYEDPAEISFGQPGIESNPVFFRVGRSLMSQGSDVSKTLVWSPSDDSSLNAGLLARIGQESIDPLDEKNVAAILAESCVGFDYVRRSLSRKKASIKMEDYLCGCAASVCRWKTDSRKEASDDFNSLWANVFEVLRIELSPKEIQALSAALRGAFLMTAQSVVEITINQLITDLILGPISTMIVGALLSRRIPQIYWEPKSAKDVVDLCGRLREDEPINFLPVLRGIFSTRREVSELLMEAYGISLN